MNRPSSQPSDTEAIPRRIWGLHPNVFFLGLVSLLTDVSSEMTFTLVPLFLSNVLGASTVIVGLIGGLSETTDAIFRIFSGRISDRIRKRKLLAVLGYGFSAIAKPFMYFASSWGLVLGVRFSDRVGKGIRSSPRDALVADSVSARERGRGFGLQRAMDTSGAMLGLTFAAVIIYLVQQGGLELGLVTYRWLVLGGVVPAVLAVLALLFFVHERRKSGPAPGATAQVLDVSQAAALPVKFKLFLVIMAVFTLGNSSDFFVILRAQGLGSPVLHVTMMLVLFNVTYAAVSLPAGLLSDKLGRGRIIVMGWAVYALVYLGFGLVTSTWQVWLLFAGYGIYYGMVEGVARALVADMVPAGKRGTAYGLYHGVVGITLLPASLIAGWLWEVVSPASPFYLGAGLAFVAALAFLALMRK